MSTLLLSDNFNRADNSSNPGFTNGSGTQDPQFWNSDKGTWGIKGNRLYCSLINGSPTTGAVWADTGTDQIDMQWTNAVQQVGFTNGGFVKYSTFQNWVRWANNSANNTNLTKLVAGVPTVLGSLHAGGADGDVMRVIVVGNTYECFRNGVLLETQTDAFLAGNGHIGFYASAPAAESNARYDDLTVFSSASLPIVPFKNPTVQTANQLLLQTTFPIQTVQGPNLKMDARVDFPSPISFQTGFAISGNTVIAIPTGTISITIAPSINNTVPITLKGVAGDTGIKLAKNQPTAFCVDSSLTSFILNTPSPINVQVTFL